MQLLVIRHAIAETREQFASTGQDDSLRPLTKEGRKRMALAAKGLRRVVGEIDLLATSPLVRAAETAAIVAREYDDVIPVPVDALKPESKPTAFISWLRQQEGAEVVAVVGHEPTLGTFVTWLLTGIAEPRVPLRKGGACLLDFAGRPARSGATLRWSLTPTLLRRIAG
jgi:phosphohistidine phosphatase